MPVVHSDEYLLDRISLGLDLICVHCTVPSEHPQLVILHMKDHILVEQNAQWANRPWDAWLFTSVDTRFIILFSSLTIVKLKTYGTMEQVLMGSGTMKLQTMEPWKTMRHKI
jgi:hypothetical protein